MLKNGGPELLAETLVFLIDHARPKDWLAARISKQETEIPWTLGIHDVGDFFFDEYVDAWRIACEQRPDCKFWFYTRSFQLLGSLSELASLINIQGWLSADSDNYSAAILTYSQALSIWKLSILQQKTDDLPDNLYPDIPTVVPADQIATDLDAM